jgi:hypothetical protein
MGTIDRCDAMRSYPELAEVVALRDAGWEFVPLREAGELLGFAGYRHRGQGSIDVLYVFDRNDCRAVRLVTDEPGAPGGLVWRFDGSLADAVRELRALPAPGAAGAPRLVIGRASLLHW